MIENPLAPTPVRYSSNPVETELITFEEVMGKARAWTARLLDV